MTVEENMERLSGIVESLAGAVAKHDERFDRIDRSIERLTRYVLDFRQEAAERLQVLEGRLEIVAITVANTETRFPPFTKGILDFGITSTNLLREQSKQRDSQSDLRLAKLEEMVSKPAV